MKYLFFLSLFLFHPISRSEQNEFVIDYFFRADVEDYESYTGNLQPGVGMQLKIDSTTLSITDVVRSKYSGIFGEVFSTTWSSNGTLKFKAGEIIESSIAFPALNNFNDFFVELNRFVDIWVACWGYTWTESENVIVHDLYSVGETIYLYDYGEGLWREKSLVINDIPYNSSTEPDYGEFWLVGYPVYSPGDDELGNLKAKRTLYTAYLENQNLIEIAVNDRDIDNDNIIDYADREIEGHSFEKLVIKIPGLEHIKEYYDELEAEYPTISVSYNHSLPYDDSSDYLTQWKPSSGQNPAYFDKPSPYLTSPLTTGHLRLWLKDASSRRKANVTDGGDFVASKSLYSLNDLIAEDGTLTLYVEGLVKTKSKQTIRVSFDGAYIDIPYEVGSDCTSCETCATGGDTSCSADNNQASLSISSGEGSVTFKNLLPTNDMSSPKGLSFSRHGANETALYDNENVLRQVKNDKGLTDIEILDENSYTVSFYDIADVGEKIGALWGTIGDPSSVVTISRPAGDINTLRVIKMDGALVTLDNEFSYDSANSQWKLGEDTDGLPGFERYTKEVLSGNNDSIKTSIIEDALGNAVSKIERHYSNDNLTLEINDPDGLNLRTSYSYLNDLITSIVNQDGSRIDYTYYTSEQVKLTTYSSGLFTENIYYEDGRLHKIIESFNGSSYSENEVEHKVTEYDYTPLVAGDDGSIRPAAIRTETVYLLGSPVTKTFYGYLPGENITIQAVTPSATVNATGNLISRALFYTDGEFKDEIYKEVNSNGTGSIINRDIDIITTESGIYNSGETAIINGTSTTVISEGDLEVSTVTSDISTGLLISSRTVTSRDAKNRETRIDYHDGTYETSVYNCCNLDATSNRAGVITYYSYDALKRVKGSTTNGVTQTNYYDTMGNTTKVTETGTDGTVRTLSESSYNLAGQLEWAKDAQGNRTSYLINYSGDGTTTQTVTFPNLKTSITTTDSEGRLTSVNGTGVFSRDADLDNEFVEFDAELGYYVQVQQYGQLENWTKSYTDALGRSYKTVSSTGSISSQIYDTNGDLAQSTNSNGAVTLYMNDNTQSVSIQALDVNQNGVIDYGTDVITRSQSEYLSENAVTYQVTRNWINPDSFATPGTEDTIRKVSNDGLLMVNTSTANGISSTLRVITQIDTNGTITTTSVSPDGSYSKTKVTSGLQESVESYDALDVLKSIVTYGYDKFNRLETQTDPRNGTTTYSYDNSDRVLAVTTSDPDGTGPKTAQSFQTFYTNMGQRDYVVHPDNSQINFNYTDQGLIENSSGSQVYPRTYRYDNKGNLTGLTTSGQAGSSTLSWSYYDNGQLQTKTDALNRQVSYTYYASGQVGNLYIKVRNSP